MSSHIDWVATAVYAGLLGLVCLVPLLSSHSGRGDLQLLEEWGLAGRSFGTIISWFLLGGDLFTAYTIIAVPGLVYAVGAPGFFALPYSTVTFCFAFVCMPRLWTACREHNYVTAADFVRARYSSHWLSLAVAVTGLVATIPYLALQLIGIQVSVSALGVGSGSASRVPLFTAFAVLTAYTYRGGLRAPASVALVKDAMIYIAVMAAVIWLPLKFGGYAHIFAAASSALAAKPQTASILLRPSAYLSYSTLMLGSSLALFLYPHSVTAILSSASARVIQRNSAMLAAYTLLLGLIALLGYGALAVGVKVNSSSEVVPALFSRVFPPYFAGFCFAAITVGALVPAAIMSIAAANLFTRNICGEYFWKALSREQEGRVAKAVSLLVSVASLVFALAVPLRYAIDLQLLGGMWILQTFPAVILGLFTRWFRASALLLGWFCGMLTGTLMVASQRLTAVYPLKIGDVTVSSYAGFDALILNLIVASCATSVQNAIGSRYRAEHSGRADRGQHQRASSKVSSGGQCAE